MEAGVTPVQRFYELLVSQNPLSKFKNLKLVKIMAQPFFICESTWNLTDGSPSIYDGKTAARPVDTIHDILRSLSPVQSLLEGRNADLAHAGANAYATG